MGDYLYTHLSVFSLHQKNMSFQLSQVCFVEETKAALLNTPFKNTLTSCNSPVIALAEHLSNDLKWAPPGWHIEETEEERDYLEPWGDYLSKIIFQGRLLVDGDVAIFFGYVPEGFISAQQDLSEFKVVETADTFYNRSPEKLMLDLYGIRVEERETKLRIAFINFSLGVKAKDKLKPKLQLAGLFAGIYFRAGDDWRQYRIHLDEIPTVEELTKFDVLIMSGSFCSVNDEEPCVVKFAEVLKEVLETNKTIRIHAACFGHQLIANIMGSSLVRHEKIIGPETVEFSPPEEDLTKESLQTIFEQGTFRVYQIHEDSVAEVPPGFIGVGSSQTCEVAAIVSEDERIFTTQFHPEYAEPYMKEVRNRTAAYLQQQPDPADKIVENEEVIEHLEHHETFREAVRAFIDGE